MNKYIYTNSFSDASGLAFEMPSNWSPMDDKENIKLVPLQQTDKEYLEVQQDFLKTTGSALTILKVKYMYKLLHTFHDWPQTFLMKTTA